MYEVRVMKYDINPNPAQKLFLENSIKQLLVPDILASSFDIPPKKKYIPFNDPLYYQMT